MNREVSHHTSECFKLATLLPENLPHKKYPLIYKFNIWCCNQDTGTTSNGTTSDNGTTYTTVNNATSVNIWVHFVTRGKKGINAVFTKTFSLKRTPGPSTPIDTKGLPVTGTSGSAEPSAPTSTTETSLPCSLATVAITHPRCILTPKITCFEPSPPYWSVHHQPRTSDYFCNDAIN